MAGNELCQFEGSQEEIHPISFEITLNHNDNWNQTVTMNATLNNIM